MPAIAAWLAAQPPAAGHAPLPAGALRLPMKCGVEAPPAASLAVKPAAEALARGEYLVRAGDCLSCHTAYGGQPFAGGRATPTPFGTLYGPNITPDPETGIGKWSAEDFWRALHEGVRRDGALLYPAFPYPNYTKVRREDADAMYRYLMSQPRVRQQNRAHEMRFPYDKRALLAGWRALYFKQGVHQDDPAQSAQWNRGAYLVEGLGHCNACHAARTALGGVKPQQETAGGLIPVLNWYAPSLTSSRETGLGDWETGEVVELLRHGVSPRGAVFGPMSEVVRDSLQHLAEADLAAMAVYLKSQKDTGEAPGGTQIQVTAEQAGQMMTRGARLYKDRCSECHQPRGEGVARIYPPLANAAAILMRDPVNAVRMVLNGGFPPGTRGNLRPFGMPPYGQVLNDDEVASLVTYVRGSWGNTAAPVSPTEVARARGAPMD
jgi:mono/diheme cytochrome c family protein